MQDGEKSVCRATSSIGGVKNRRLYGIDFLKIISVIVVFSFHCNMHLSVKFGFLTPFISQGAIFMDLFFMISGYALEYNQQNRPLISIEKTKMFYRSRIVAIYPLYFLMHILFTLFLDAAPQSQKLMLAPIELSLIQSFFSGLFPYSHNGGSWFLSCLMLCYLIFPLAHNLMADTKGEKLYVVLGINYLLSAISPLIVIWLELPNLYSSPYYRSLEFLSGMILARWMFHQKRPKSTRLFALAAGGAFCTLVLFINMAVEKQFQLGSYITYSFVTWPLFVLLLVGTAKIQPPSHVCLLLKQLSTFVYPAFLSQFFVWSLCQEIVAYTKWCGNLAILGIATLVWVVLTLAFWIINKFVQNKLRMSIK